MVIEYDKSISSSVAQKQILIPWFYTKGIYITKFSYYWRTVFLARLKVRRMCQLCLILTRGLCCLRRWNVCCWKKSEWNLSLPYSSPSYVLDCIVKWDSVHIFQLKHGIDLSIETILPRKFVHLKLTLDLPISGSIGEILITMENVPAFCFKIFLCLKPIVQQSW